MVPSAPLLRRDEEPKGVDAPPEAEPRPLPFARLFGGGGYNASAPGSRPRERPASLSVGPACSNIEAATATAFRGGGGGGGGWLRRRLGPSGRDVLCKPAQDGRHPVPQKVPETTSLIFLETVPVTVLEKVPETTSLIFLETVSVRVSEKVPETTSLIFLETVPVTVPEKVPETTLLIF